jgi:hypothetical protein
VRKPLAVSVALLLLAPAAALGKTTPNITFKSTGKAAAPGAVVGLNEDGTYEDVPFKIAADDTDGTVSVEVHWGNPADDWDLYVFKKNSKGGLDQVGSSAGAPPATSESTVIQAQAGPVEPGDYVIRVQNYAATSPDFEGVAKFTEYAKANVKPTAALAAPRKGTAGKAVTLDASGSKDSDGKIVGYAWDLDGDGSMETSGGAAPTLKHAFPAGVHHVGVRVTDDKGARAYATRTIRVAQPVKKKKRRKRGK